jgi:hypothetical protein
MIKLAVVIMSIVLATLALLALVLWMFGAFDFPEKR